MMRPLVWFRSDLRTDDNPALHAATQIPNAQPLAIFVLTPRQWIRHDWGPPRVDFLLRNLQSLSLELQRLGVPLLVRQCEDYSGVPQVLDEIVAEFGIDTVLFNREHAVDESERDRRVSERLRKNVTIGVSEDQVVVPPSEIASGQGTPYSVFTPFKKKWIQWVHASPPETVPPPGAREPAELVPSDAVPECIDGFEPPHGLREIWPAGESAARDRLGSFLDESAEQYAGLRDVAAVKGTSRLSPYLSLGVLSVRQCFLAAVAANCGHIEGGQDGLDTWISELIWREFYRHVLVGFPRVSMNRAFRSETESIPWRGEGSEFDAWCRGQTGVPFVDAGMRQLLSTGWMHNRLRMVTAMFLTKDLLVDWRLGERFFMQRLVDGDLASNNGGWQWCASTGTDASPYFRIFNPWTQGASHDPQAAFIRKWVPQLAALGTGTIHSEKRMARLERGSIDYPPPIVDHAEARARVLEAFQDLALQRGSKQPAS